MVRLGLKQIEGRGARGGTLSCIRSEDATLL